MFTVKEVSRRCGVSVRTLHHYDAIGLLKPSAVTDAGYRLYDSAAIDKLGSILLFRELRFSLAEIREMLTSPGFDPAEALSQQIALLEMQKKRAEELIAFARRLKEGGTHDMGFDKFDLTEFDRRKDEVRAKWGHTEAYREYENRGEKGAGASDGLMAVFAGFGAIKDGAPDSDAALKTVGELQAYITEHFYTCTPEILLGLGDMYVSDDRFAKNIDAAGGAGTAEFAKLAIGAWYKKQR